MFKINNQKWDLKFVSPNAEILYRSDGSKTVGVTDGDTHCIYIADNVCGDFLKRVLTHEICHAYIISNDIYLPIQIEEYICDAVAQYGETVTDLSDCILKNLVTYCGE